MTDRFEDSYGRNTFISIEQVKDYLSISSNTQDARLANIISYATGVVEHYIGQQILANTYVELFDGGKSSVFVSRLPLNEVYELTEFNGQEHVILADPTVLGTAVTTSSDSVVFDFKNNAKLTDKVKRFGKTSLKLTSGDFLEAASVPDSLEFEESDFTIEMFIRVDSSALSNASLIAFNTDSENYMQLNTITGNCLSFVSTVNNVTSVVSGANSNIETEQFTRKKWAHVALTRDASNEKLYLHYNGNTIANATYTEDSLAFTSNIVIGQGFEGYIDELSITTSAKYAGDFTAPEFRSRPADGLKMLLHFDGSLDDRSVLDVHNAVNEFSFSIDKGEITRDTGAVGVRGTYPTIRNNYPALTLSGPPSFKPFPSAIKVQYKAGYEQSKVPFDIQLATLDFIKIIYKQDQEKKGFSFEGESGTKNNLSGNFPPHIRRILDLYRIIY